MARIALVVVVALAILSVRSLTASASTTLTVVRVGDGSTALTTAAFPVFLDEIDEGGLPVSTTPLPTAPSGANVACTLSGTATSEGALSQSSDANYLTLAGYAAAPGTASVASTSGATVNRVVARVDALHTIDTSSHLVAFDGSNVRGAATADGSAFWMSGASSGTSGGLWYLTLGSNAGTKIAATPASTRVPQVFNGQLYCDSGSSSFTCVSTVGTGEPTMAGQVFTTLPGMTTTGASPYAFSISADGKTCYVADDRTIASGGGVQKWTFDGITWSLKTTFNQGLTSGCRGLCVDYSGAKPLLFATTAASTANQIVKFVDDGGGANAVVLATAATNVIYRGIALSPAPSVLAVDPHEGAATRGVQLAVAPVPCRSSSRVAYTLPAAGHVTLALFGTDGRWLRTLVNGDGSAGRFTVTIERAGLVPGIYFLELREGSARTSARFVVVR